MGLHYFVDAGRGSCHLILLPLTNRSGTILVINTAESLASDLQKTSLLVFQSPLF